MGVAAVVGGGYRGRTATVVLAGLVLSLSCCLSVWCSHPCVEKENGKTPSSDKSRLRKCWEVYHAVSGFLSVAVGLGQVSTTLMGLVKGGVAYALTTSPPHLAPLQVTLGVLLIDAPMITWAVWAAIAGLWIVLLVIHEFVRICWFCCRWCRKSD